MNNIQENQIIGYWTVLHRSQKKSGNNSVAWTCKCICGKIKDVRGYYLKSGVSLSCGCMNALSISTKMSTHGDSGGEHGKPHYLYRTWSGIIQRTTNPNDRAWQDYGGRGITMQNDWLKNYQKFKEWILNNIGERPSTEHSLDRINNDKGYEEGNLRWATKKQQIANRRQNKRLIRLELLKRIFNSKV